ncbi:diadenylate cyclase CdaA [Anaerolinea sp.]|uniref:diadenylate cyclase CdaA n=1 Tax=Anaerolinea sp. TaxID=1872519 RepID=UPI002ACEA75B|nr:diadenylate cyclase CdaA [Anaerolinea sp.]
MTDLLDQIYFLFERLTWMSVLDIALVTLIIFIVLIMVRETQAVILLRGVILLVIFLSLLTSLVNLPAFSWLIRTIMPALLLAIPVIFAPEIRRGLERLGRAGSSPILGKMRAYPGLEDTIHAIVTAAIRLSNRGHGALIVIQRNDPLEEFISTGVALNARVTPELLLQIFYPNTPLHDGAAIVVDNQIAAAACVMPLSSSGILNRSPERQMGLRHRAALGISEATDAIAVVVSEETGLISLAHNGRMIRRLDGERLENILMAFYLPSQPPPTFLDWLRGWLGQNRPREER